MVTLYSIVRSFEVPALRDERESPVHSTRTQPFFCLSLEFRVLVFTLRAITICQRSSAMSFELNQSVECPEALRTRIKRYTALPRGQRYSRKKHRADRHKWRSAPRVYASKHSQISDSACRISCVLCGQHDGSMTVLRGLKLFSSGAITKKNEVRAPSLATSSCAHLNFCVRQSKVARTKLK